MRGAVVVLGALALVGCARTRQLAPVEPAAGAAASANLIQPLPAGPATAVVELAPGTPSAVLAGPFEVYTINPGGDLAFAIAPTTDCAAAGLRWFSYSGSGVAVGTGQTLCARTSSRGTHGFSGRSPMPAAAPAP